MDAEAEIEKLRKALMDVRDAILQAHRDDTLNDTLWMLTACPETVVDHIHWALGEDNADVPF